MISEKKPTHRIEKLNSLLQKIVGETIQNYLEGGPGIVSVSKAEVSRDSKWVKIWISILGGDDDAVMKLLNKHIYEIQGELNRSMTIKMVPRIQFFLDTSGRYAAHISEIINKIHEEEN